MRIAVVKYNYSPFDGFDSASEWSNYRWPGDNEVLYISRAPNSFVQKKNGIEFHTVADRLPPVLLWWQRAAVFDNYIAKLKPQLVHIVGLKLPLHFRFLKRKLPAGVKLYGEFHNDKLWNQKMLWLQMRGLRVADGFIYPDRPSAEPWLKCAAVLEKQEMVYFKV